MMDEYLKYRVLMLHPQERCAMMITDLPALDSARY